eukprot:15345900-Ditylum_brightwellii.AAC.1
MLVKGQYKGSMLQLWNNNTVHLPITLANLHKSASAKSNTPERFHGPKSNTPPIPSLSKSQKNMGDASTVASKGSTNSVGVDSVDTIFRAHVQIGNSFPK